MKLNSLLPSVSKMELMHPEMGATGVVLSLIGQDTKAFRDKAKSISKAVVGKASKDVDMDAVVEQSLELVAICIVGWTGLEDEEGNEIPYSPAKAQEIVSDPGLSYLKEQVEEFVSERKNFFRSTKQ